MKKTLILKNNKASILILALWALTLLTVFAVNISMRVRQKMIVLSRLEDRSKLNSVVASGVRKAQGIFNLSEEMRKVEFTASKKKALFNNPEYFKGIKLGPGSCDVSYFNYDSGSRKSKEMYGIMDEERNLNINKADHSMLMKIIQYAVSLKEDEASKLANAIIDWREYGESEIVGFYSDDYYSNLRQPYRQKKEDFEQIDELLLVKGMNKAIFDKLKDFITVYGDGRVNMNTTSKPVLMAFGLSEGVVDALLFYRKGNDGKESTSDDYTFPETGHVFMDIIQSGIFDPEAIAELEMLISLGGAGTKSAHYRIQATGKLTRTEETKLITCVFNGNNGKIVYWRED